MKNVYIGLGSNIGDKKLFLQKARQEISQIKGVSVVAVSSLYQSEPWGKIDQEDFINQVIAVTTDLSPLELLHVLQCIEIKLGRQRKEKWGPRTIDLDILLWGEECLNTKELIVPHPYLQQRLFVLLPLVEINPDLMLPTGESIKEVLSTVYDREGGNKIKKL